MSDRRKRSNRYPTRWSEWERSERYQRNVRYREIAQGKWEWDYSEPYIERTHATPWTHDSSLGPDVALPIIEEQSTQHNEEEAAGKTFHIGSGVFISVADDLQGKPSAIETAFSQLRLEPDAASTQTDDGRRFGTENDSKGKEIPCPTCSLLFSRESDLERHHKTVHLKEVARPYQCPFPNCSAYVKSWATAAKLRLHIKTWHSSDEDAEKSRTMQPSQTSQQPESNVPEESLKESGSPEKSPQHHATPTAATSSGPTGFSVYALDLESYAVPVSGTSDENAGYDAHAAYVGPSSSYPAPSPYATPSSYPAPSPYATPSSYAALSTYVPPPRVQDNTTRFIRPENSNLQCHKLDSEYKTHMSSEFRFGRVFKVLWAEPVGSGGTELTAITANPKYNEKAFHKIRRFVIIRNLRGHSMCIPILTYGYQGVLKYGVHPDDHAVIYSSRRDGPYMLDGEQGLMSKQAIRVEIKDPSNKLNPISRLNYAKVYTVEHNVKVCFIGEVAKTYEQKLVVAFNETHPPLTSRHYPDGDDSADEYTMNAQRADPSYQNAMNMPRVPSGYDSSSTQPYTSGYSNPAYNASEYPTPYNDSVSRQYGLSYSANPTLPTTGYPAAQSMDYDQSNPTYEDAYDP